MTEQKRLLLEAMGGVMLIAGLAVIHIALGLVAAGVLFILWANFSEKENGDAPAQQHAEPPRPDVRP